MPLKTSSFHRLMNCRCLILYFFCFHIRKVIVEAEFTLCGYLHGSINKSHHYIGSGPCSLEVSINPTGLEIKANLIENGPSICMEDIVATAPNASSEFCITWKEHFGQLFLTHGDVVKTYSTAAESKRKCCQNFILTNNISRNDSPLLTDIIYINGPDFSPVHIENACYLEFIGSEAACELSLPDCIKQQNKLIQLAARVDLKQNDARYAMLLTNSILENCSQSISDGWESHLSTVMLKMNFPKNIEIFVTPNVKAAVIRNWTGNAEFVVVANFSWVGADSQTMFAAVRVILKHVGFGPPLPCGVITHFKNKTSIQDQEKIPVSPSVTVQVGNLSIDDLSIPLTVTFQSLRFKSNPNWCASMASGQDAFNWNGCNPINSEGTIICSCDRLGYSFTLTLESKKFNSLGLFSGPFKITTQSNYSNNVNITPSVTGSPCETSLESTTSVSSSTEPNKRCNNLFEQWRENDSKQCLDAIKTANMLMQKCHNQTPDITSVGSILENKLTYRNCEGETQVGETEYIIFYIKKVNPVNFTGIQFPNSDTENIFTSNLQVEIKLPSTLLDNVNISNYFNTTALQITFLIFKEATFFQDQNKSMILNYVTGIQMGNTNISNLTDPVIIAFNKSSSRESILKCVFWEVEQNGNRTIRHWSESGCTTENTDHQTICRCNHLTFFAVLMQLNRNQSLDKKTLTSLTYITQIGCGLSAIFTTITLIIHYTLRERHKEFSIQIHVNLSAALFFLNVTFLINIWLSSRSTGGFCKAIAFLLHYSLLCSFTWMGIEAFHLYIMLVKVFNTYIKCYMLKLHLVGWGIPAVVLFIIVGINIDFYGRYVIPVNGNYNSTNHDFTSMCWITNKTVFYVTIIAYFALIFLGNTTMLTVLCVKVIKLKGGDKKNIFTILGLTCLLGITYGIAFFTYGSQSIPALYLFCILNPLQGFFIFLWYCMLIRSSINTAGETSKTNRSTTG